MLVRQRSEPSIKQQVLLQRLQNMVMPGDQPIENTQMSPKKK
jgi:hypothetical protein